AERARRARAAVLRLGRPAPQRPGQGPRRGHPPGQGRVRPRRHPAAAHRLPRGGVARGAAAGQPRALDRAAPRRGRGYFGQPRPRRPARRGPAFGCRRRGQHARPRQRHRQGHAMTPSTRAMPPAVLPAAVIAALVLGLPATPAFGQSAETAPAQPGFEACALVEVDADRLACYDRVAGREAANPARADAAAALARENRDAASEAEAAAGTPADRVRNAANDLFSSEPDDAL